jgi:hypothetical protein
MGMQPHVHSCEETKANIAKIEHNAAGQGPGPSEKRGGPPTGIEAVSGEILNTGGKVISRHKGADWITERTE